MIAGGAYSLHAKRRVGPLVELNLEARRAQVPKVDCDRFQPFEFPCAPALGPKELLFQAFAHRQDKAPRDSFGDELSCLTGSNQLAKKGRIKRGF